MSWEPKKGDLVRTRDGGHVAVIVDVYLSPQAEMTYYHIMVDGLLWWTNIIGIVEIED